MRFHMTRNGMQSLYNLAWSKREFSPLEATGPVDPVFGREDAAEETDNLPPEGEDELISAAAEEAEPVVVLQQPEPPVQRREGWARLDDARELHLLRLGFVRL